MNQDTARPDLSGEVRFRVPLVFAIPFGALLIIGLLAFAFAEVLLSLESKEAATTIAMVLAANVLAACAYVALRPRLKRGAIVELALVALYPVVIGIAIAQVGLVGGEEAETHGAPPAPTESAAGGAGASELVAVDIAWNVDSLSFKAGQEIEMPLDNQDTTVHNMSIYETPEDAQTQTDPLFKGEDVAGGASSTYSIDPLKKGEYTFICDYHVNMEGTVTVQ
ncbi:MAG: cupredoxin domain-containing protein [Actinomycetota bacterium]|nr:cupredoxin domain-containing protein [Actinomycetota bacterium]